jgi:hypothetical protein
MKTFTVMASRMCTDYYEVQAETKEDAVARFWDNEGDYKCFHTDYHDTEHVEAEEE